MRMSRMAMEICLGIAGCGLVTLAEAAGAVGTEQDQAITLNGPGFDLFSLKLGTTGLSYERRFALNASWTAGAAFRQTNYTDVADYTFNLSELTGAYRFYAASEALHGVYFSPFATMRFSTVKFVSPLGVAGTSSAILSGGFGGSMGYQWMADFGLIFDLEAGWENNPHSRIPRNGIGNHLFYTRMALGFGW